MNNELYLYNTLTHRKERFQPIMANFVGMYVCGITVYDYCHLGHARVMIFFDVVRRYLAACGFRVKYVRNITDIDDKIIKRANENNEPIDALTNRFIAEMHRDEKALNMLPPHEEPRATDHIIHIIQLIEELFKHDIAYIAENGDVCFEVERFKNYGQLSHQDLEKLQHGARVAIAESKRNPLDFVLWKLAKPGEPQWDSPWGKGRPGWHIECSAMSMQCLGEHFDIHGGGFDLTFPHHENEIAQSEAATEQKFVNTWMHVGFVQINKEKMSKSLGNFFTVREALTQFKGEVIRYFMLSSHYRSPINYSLESLGNAHAALQRCYIALRGLDIITVPKDFGESYRQRFHDKMNDDFNTPEAMAVLFDIVHEINCLRELGKNMEASQYAALLRELALCLGILQDDPQAFWQNLSADDLALTKQIEALIAQRNQARLEKNWALADQFRDQLLAMGITLEDTASGTQWRKN